MRYNFGISTLKLIENVITAINRIVPVRCICIYIYIYIHHHQNADFVYVANVYICFLPTTIFFCQWNMIGMCALWICLHFIFGLNHISLSAHCISQNGIFWLYNFVVISEINRPPPIHSSILNQIPNQ